MQKVDSSLTASAHWNNDLSSEKSMMECFFAKKAKGKKEQTDLSGSELFSAAQQILFTAWQAEKGVKGGVHSGDIQAGSISRSDNNRLSPAADAVLSNTRVFPGAVQALLPGRVATLPEPAPKKEWANAGAGQAVNTSTSALADEHPPEKVDIRTAKSKGTETFNLSDRSSFPQMAGSSGSESLSSKATEVNSRQQTIKHAHAGPLPAQVHSAPESGFRFQFSQWGQGKHVTINALPDQIMFQPSDSQVQQRMASQWNDDSRAGHWQLAEEEHSDRDQKHPRRILPEEDEA